MKIETRRIPAHIAGLTDENGFTEKESVFVECMLSGMNKTDSAKKAGYAEPGRAGHTVAKRPQVRDAIYSGIMSRLETDGVQIASQTLLDLMKPENPPSVRLGAASKVLETARNAKSDRENKDLDTKDIYDMSADQLDAFISAGFGALEKRGKVLDITPETIDKTET
jgi:hypothetical protein